MPTPTKQSLRKQLRQQRLSLNSEQQRQNALALASIASEQHWFTSAKNVAFYLANDGEINPQFLIDLSARHEKHCFLPRITEHKSLTFHHFASDQLEINKYGIAEPTSNQKAILPDALDIIFMPLVAFDQQGNRLGMGGGYYDRTLANLEKPKPLLIGLGHDFQQTDTIEAEMWDIKLDGVITEKRAIRF